MIVVCSGWIRTPHESSTLVSFSISAMKLKANGNLQRREKQLPKSWQRRFSRACAGDNNNCAKWRHIST
jgi:hypothetical protein